MLLYPIPDNEAGRLAALRELKILDTAPEPLYDDVALLAAAVCRTPIAIVNFVDEHRQWGKALVGLDDSEAPREASFCARTIVREDGLLIVRDTHADPAWATNAQVTGDPHLRFYAGAAIVTADGHAMGSVCVADREARDIDAQARTALLALARQTAAHLDLRRTAVRDGLTGLANRVLLHDRLALALAQRRRSGRDLGVLFCDLDGFKAVNDGLGHHAGDELLRAVARRMSGVARDSDTVSRIAGDEFVVLCPDLTSPDDLQLVADRIAAAVTRPVSLSDGATVTPQVSIGSTLAAYGDDADAVLRRADEAMYFVKRTRSDGSGPQAAAA